jgi:hypothetical protein
MSALFRDAFYRRDTVPIPYNGGASMDGFQAWLKVRTGQIANTVRRMLPDLTNGLTDPEVRNLWITRMDAGRSKPPAKPKA